MIWDQSFILIELVEGRYIYFSVNVLFQINFIFQKNVDAVYYKARESSIARETFSTKDNLDVPCGRVSNIFPSAIECYELLNTELIG